MGAQLIGFLDYINPYLQIGFASASFVCAAYCTWSTYRHFNTGLLLLGIYCLGASIQTVLFAVSAFQGDKPFLPLPFEVRRTAYLGGRLLGPVQGMLFAITVLLIARHNIGAAKRRLGDSRNLTPTLRAEVPTGGDHVRVL